MWSTPPSCFPDTNFPLFLWIPQSITVPGISKGDKTDRFFRKNRIQKSSMNCNLFKNHDGPIDLQKPHVAVVGINNSLPVGTFMPILPLGTLGTTAKNLVWTTNPNKLVTSFYPSKKKVIVSHSISLHQDFDSQKKHILDESPANFAPRRFSTSAKWSWRFKCRRPRKEWTSWS